MQKRIRRSWQQKAAIIAMALFSTTYASTVYALPQNGTVTSGAATVSSESNTMTVNQSTDKVAIDWNSFNINKGESVNFAQPSNTSIALNRVTGSSASAINGSLNANGRVFLINQNGILFGQGSSVNVGGLVASTHDISNSDFEKGSYTFAGSSAAAVKNAGKINAEGGVVALLASDVENSGTITTKSGTTALLAGSNINIDYTGSGKINFTVNKSIADAKALNSGTIQADGGYVYMTARDASTTLNTVVNNTGVIEAKSLKNVNGTIVLDGGDQGVVKVGGSIDASGDEAGQTGGTIKVSGQYTNVAANLKASGNEAGGTIDTSGQMVNISSTANVDASSANGQAGTWTILSSASDPLTVKVVDGKTAVELAQSNMDNANAELEKQQALKDAYDAAIADREAKGKVVDEMALQYGKKSQQYSDAKDAYNAAKQAVMSAKDKYNAKTYSAAKAAAEKEITAYVAAYKDTSTGNQVSYISAGPVSNALSKGTNVTITAQDTKSPVSSVELDTPL